MGVDISVYRLRIGTALMPNKSRSRMSVLCVSRNATSMCLRVLVAASLLLVVSGDIEVNPGPTQRQTVQNGQSSQVSTRQRTLSFAQATSATVPQTDRRLSYGHTESQGGVMAFLNTMKMDIAGQNKQIRSDLTSLSSKIDENESINNLKVKNQNFKEENVIMRE